VKSTPTRGVKQFLKPDTYKQSEPAHLWRACSGVGNQKSEVRKRRLTWRTKRSCARSRIWKFISALNRLALELHRASLKFPRIEQFALADQIRRASKSICADIAEGFARQRSPSADFQRFIVLALGSGDEMKVWLSFCADLAYVSEADARRMRDEDSIVARMLHELRSKWK
jgi:four helix bundle protein